MIALGWLGENAESGSFVAHALVLAMSLWLGRAVLSFLPPGAVGSTDARTTWAASQIVGSSTWLALFVWTPWFHSEHAIRAGFVLAAVLTALRMLGLPAALVPRHEPARAAQDGWTQWFQIAAVMILCFVLPGPLFGEGAVESDPRSVLVFADAIAALLMIEFGLDRARASAWMRHAAMLAFALVVVLRGVQDVHGLALASAMCFVSGAAFTIAWLRRADKRALFLAVISFASAAPWSPNGWTCAIAGLAWLVVGTAKPSRMLAATAALAFAAIGGGLTWLVSHAEPSPWASDPIAISATKTELSQAFLLALFGVVITARWVDARNRRRRAPTTSGAPYALEDTILLRMTTSSLLVGFLAQIQWNTPGDPLLPAMSVLALLFGASLKRFDSQTSWR